MKKNILLFSAAALTAILSSCSVTKPLSVSAAPMGSKTGVSRTSYIFGFRTNRNFGIAEAAHIGRITGGVGAADLRTTRSGTKIFFYREWITVYGN